jgi:hypothetical protein
VVTILAFTNAPELWAAMTDVTRILSAIEQGDPHAASEEISFSSLARSAA